MFFRADNFQQLALDLESEQNLSFSRNKLHIISWDDIKQGNHSFKGKGVLLNWFNIDLQRWRMKFPILTIENDPSCRICFFRLFLYLTLTCVPDSYDDTKWHKHHHYPTFSPWTVLLVQSTLQWVDQWSAISILQTFFASDGTLPQCHSIILDLFS